jgi:predicted DCC family thiol-disulfide oxidoreductase YuxK
MNPVLIYDGDCGFCRFWLARWRHALGDGLECIPFQDPQVAERFPNLSSDQLNQAIHLVEPDGTVYCGARAVFQALERGWSPLPLWAYRGIPGVAPVSEFAYRTVARNRPFFSRITTALWGRSTRRSTYASANWLFLRLLGFVYLAAFWSLGSQVLALIGHNGISPADVYMAAARQLASANHLGILRVYVMPTLCWFGTSDMFLKGLCTIGIIFSALLIAGAAPVLVLPVLWLLYLSLAVVSREFLEFQWDFLLLEAGFLAIFVAPWTRGDRLKNAVDPPKIGAWLLRWLLFRLTFGSGIVKLASGDIAWHGLTALAVHYQTQPLPTPLSWYAHQLPFWFQKASTAGVLAIELVAPWFIFAPRRLRSIACAFMVGLQILIALTGNYAFFNLLTIALCLFLLDDDALAWARPLGAGLPAVAGVRRSPAKAGSPATTGRFRRWALVALAVLTVPVSTTILSEQAGVPLPGSLVVRPLFALAQPFRSLNGYGLFAVMTMTRDEIIVEGSNDGSTWQAYEFAYKPGDVHRSLPWAAPRQPRLDWQMWFAALAEYDNESWLKNFLVRLLQGTPEVLQLLAYDPFHGHPPRFVRCEIYRYRFSDTAERRADGAIWTRHGFGAFSPVLTLGQK